MKKKNLFIFTADYGKCSRLPLLFLRRLGSPIRFSLIIVTILSQNKRKSPAVLRNTTRVVRWFVTCLRERRRRVGVVVKRASARARANAHGPHAATQPINLCTLLLLLYLPTAHRFQSNPTHHQVCQRVCTHTETLTHTHTHAHSRDAQLIWPDR